MLLVARGVASLAYKFVIELSIKSETCGGFMSPSSTWMYLKDTCIRARHVADTCCRQQHGCIRRIHVSERDMWWIHVTIGDMDVSEGYMYPSATCTRYMYLVDGDLKCGLSWPRVGATC